MIGAIVLAGLTGAFVNQVESDPRIADEVAAQVSVAAQPGIDFVDSSQIETAADKADIDDRAGAAIVDDYETAQLQALKAGLLAAALLALISLAFTGGLPHEAPTHDPDEEKRPVMATGDPGAGR